MFHHHHHSKRRQGSKTLPLTSTLVQTKTRQKVSRFSQTEKVIVGPFGEHTAAKVRVMRSPIGSIHDFPSAVRSFGRDAAGRCPQPAASACLRFLTSPVGAAPLFRGCPIFWRIASKGNQKETNPTFEGPRMRHTCDHLWGRQGCPNTPCQGVRLGMRRSKQGTLKLSI